MLWASSSPFHSLITNDLARWVIMGVFMGATALFIFYSPFTAPSGAHINPAVTIAFWRVGGIGACDALFYVLFQFLGGLSAVYGMAALMGGLLTDRPVNYVVTVPGKHGVLAAAVTEYLIAFIMMGMVLLTSSRQRWKQHTRGIAGCLVCPVRDRGRPGVGVRYESGQKFRQRFSLRHLDRFLDLCDHPFRRYADRRRTQQALITLTSDRFSHRLIALILRLRSHRPGIQRPASQPPPAHQPPAHP